MSALLVLGSGPVLAGALEGSVKVSSQNETTGLSNTLVVVEGVPSELEPDRDPLIDQVDQTFEPHVLATRTGVEVKFMNSEMITHNVRLMRQEDDKQLMNKMTFAGQSTTYTFEQPGAVAVRCDIHPSMLAYTIVMDNPFLSTETGDDGSFALDLPEELNSEVTVRAWNEDQGFSSSSQVQVEEGSVDKSVEIVFQD